MGYKSTIYKDDMIHVLLDGNSFLSHEIEINSELDGELNEVIVNKKTGDVIIKFKSDKREKQFDDEGDYIKPLDKDKDFKVSIIE